MLPLSRRGLTLVELLVSLVLLGVVVAGLFRGLVTSQRAYLAQAQRAALQQNLRAAATILPAAFRELDAADSDITAMSATAITLRATQQVAFLCTAPEQLPGGIVTLRVREHPIYGTQHTFDSGDSVLLYYEGDPATPSDDAWLRGQVLGATNRDCPDPDRARAGFELTLRLAGTGDEAHIVSAGFTTGSPLRGFASVTYALYHSGADQQWYLGQQLAGSTIQPLVGPLLGPSGLTFNYFDTTGSATATPTAVAEIELRLRGRTVDEVDSLNTRIALRNNPQR